MLTVNFESPPGVPTSDRVFAPGQDLRIAGHMAGSSGLPAWGSSVQVTITGDGVYEYGDAMVDFFGNYYIDFVLPYVNAQANVQAVGTFTWLGQDIVDVPIAIGSAAPDPVPSPGPPGGPLDTLEKTLKWVAIGAGVIALAYLASKAAPSVASAVRRVKQRE